VKQDSSHPTIRSFVNHLAAGGRYHFTASDSRQALGGTAAAAKVAIGRLARHGMVASPARGFYVIVPPEYQALGCLPADQFIPDLMAHLGQSYYAGLLTAAQYHGAGHHRPQAFQVMVAKNRRPIVCGSVRVEFIANKMLDQVPVEKINTLRGSLIISTPEATAVDLVAYPDHAGGIDNVATLLSELAERIDPDRLVKAAQLAPMPIAQRLGYLLERVEAGDKAEALQAYVAAHARTATPLVPGVATKNHTRDARWKLIVNADVEHDA
jgi:predicted transcriptional regulator of viral defense system